MLWNLGSQHSFLLIKQLRIQGNEKDIPGTGFLWCQWAIRRGILSFFFNQCWLEYQVWSSVRFTVVVSAAFTLDSQSPRSLMSSPRCHFNQKQEVIKLNHGPGMWVYTVCLAFTWCSLHHPFPGARLISCAVRYRGGNVFPAQKLINLNPEAWHLNSLLQEQELLTTAVHDH